MTDVWVVGVVGVDACVEVDVPSLEEDMVVETIVCAFTDEVVEPAFAVVEVGDATVEEVGVGVEETAEVIGEAAVPTGTFCRYCRGRRASSMFRADDNRAERRSSTYAEAPERNILIWW